ncbi:MAG: energy-coupling factor transporter transmembrane protein EcfT [Eggerthellaceae bacterium]|nr:energy-coupling factor transporter transmembrane protein EcfT [Eggerthellaceae bacterium]
MEETREHTAASVDARVKIVLMLAYAIALFFVDTWIGLAVAAIAFVVAFAKSRLSAARVFLVSFPVYVLVAFMLVSSSFVFADVGGQATEGLVCLTGNLCFAPEGFCRSCLFAVRIVLIVWMCLIVTFSVTSTEVIDAMRWFLLPLRKLGLQTDDAAMIASIAVRFIPIMFEEFFRVRAAQWSRGGLGSEFGLLEQIKGWTAVLMPMLVGLFRRADALSVAMDARCYGAAETRTSLTEARVGSASKALAVGGLASLLLLAIAF